MENPKFDQINPSELMTAVTGKFSASSFDGFDENELFASDDQVFPVLDNRHFNVLEQQLTYLGYNPIGISLYGENGEFRDFKAAHGRIGKVDCSVGVVDLAVTSDGKTPLQAVLIRSEKNPQEGFDLQGNRIDYNDGVALVFLLTDGTIFAQLINPNADYKMTSFVPSFSENVGMGYPKDAFEAREAIKNIFKPNSTELPLVQDLSMLVTAAADVYRGRKRNYLEEQQKLIVLNGEIKVHDLDLMKRHQIKAARFDTGILSEKLQTLVQEEIAVNHIKLVELADYDNLLRNLVAGNYPTPTFFRSHELGFYASINAPWNNQDASYGIIEMLGYSNVDFKSGIILPPYVTHKLEQYNETIENVIAHYIILAVYENLPVESQDKLLAFAEENVHQVKDLLSFCYLSVGIPDKDLKSPYSFNKYSILNQHKLMAGAIAGIMTINKDLYTYWHGKPLWGDGKVRWHWLPKGFEEVLNSVGFKTDNLPQVNIHPPGVRHVSKNGEIEFAERPYADPDLKV